MSTNVNRKMCNQNPGNDKWMTIIQNAKTPDKYHNL